MNDLISIIVPMYNAEQYIEKCIESVLNQTYKNFELIIINDCSADKSAEKCKKYLDENPNILLIHNQKNIGPSLSRKSGIENSKGNYVVFIDADDIILPQYLEKLYCFAVQNNIDIVECGYNNVNINGEIINTNNRDKVIIENKDSCLEYFLPNQHFTNFLWNKIYKVSIFENIIFHNLYYSEDYALLIQLFNNSKKIAFIDDVLYNYYHIPTSLCRSSYNIKQYDQIRAGILVHDYVKKHNNLLTNFTASYICIYAAKNYAKLKNMNRYDEKLKDMKKIFKQYYKNVNTLKLLKERNISFRRAVLMIAFSMNFSILINRFL